MLASWNACSQAAETAQHTAASHRSIIRHLDGELGLGMCILQYKSSLQWICDKKGFGLLIERVPVLDVHVMKSGVLLSIQQTSIAHHNSSTCHMLDAHTGVHTGV